MALAQVTAISQTLLRIFPPGTFPPNILKYDASSVPILQLGLESKTLSEQELFDLGQNFIRTQLATIQGAAVPLALRRQVPPDHGGPESRRSCTPRGISATDVSNALSAAEPDPARRHRQDRRTAITRSSSTAARACSTRLNDLPIKVVNGATVYIKDVAQVRDGYAVQTSIVRTNGTRGALMTVLRNGRASTLAIVNAVKARLPKILAGLPPELNVRQLFDQSLFVRASINGVVREAVIAAFLTGLMILLFLGSWRSTIIVCISIPLSILTSLIVLSLLGETINVMTLGGLALAVGILVDDATVEIENTHRNMAMKKPLVRAVLDGAQQIAAPAFVSTLSICIVFVPVLLLTGAAKFLFTPLAMAVVFAMMASYLLSRTLIPNMVHYMLKPEVKLYVLGEHGETAGGKGIIWRVHYALQPPVRNDALVLHRPAAWALDHRAAVLAGFGIFVVGSLCLVTFIGRDFFPTVDSGQMRLHAWRPAGTRIEETEVRFRKIEDEIRSVIPAREIDTIIDNIGIPIGGFNLAFGDSPHHRHRRRRNPDFAEAGRPRPHRGLHRETAQAAAPEISRCMTFFFEPANITNQILNFGLPAPIDLQVVGRDPPRTTPSPSSLARAHLAHPGAADVHVHQVVDYPEIRLNVDRSKAGQVGFTQRDVSNSLLISLSGSGQVAPNEWLNWANGVNYGMAVQTPQYRLDSLAALMRTPISAPINGVLSTTATRPPAPPAL